MSNETAEIEVVEGVPANVVKTHETSADNMLAVAKSYVIDSPEMAEAAAADLGLVKAALKKLEDERIDLKKPVLEAGRKIDSLFERLKSRYLQAEAVLKPALLNWHEAERKRAEEQRRQQEEAARKLREEEQRKAREAEEARLAAEAEARKAAEAGDVEAMFAAEEKAAEAAQAEAVAIETAEVLQHAAPVAVAAPAKLAGVSTRQEWKAEVTDLMALVKAVAEGNASIELLQANQVEINKRAKALKKEFNVPGVRVYSEPNLSARAAR